MSSISPIVTKDFAARINALGCDCLDAPRNGVSPRRLRTAEPTPSGKGLRRRSGHPKKERAMERALGKRGAPLRAVVQVRGVGSELSSAGTANTSRMVAGSEVSSVAPKLSR